MNKKIIKKFIIPGALGLTLVFQCQVSHASEAKENVSTVKSEQALANPPLPDKAITGPKINITDPASPGNTTTPTPGVPKIKPTSQPPVTNNSDPASPGVPKKEPTPQPPVSNDPDPASPGTDSNTQGPHFGEIDQAKPGKIPTPNSGSTENPTNNNTDPANPVNPYNPTNNNSNPYNQEQGQSGQITSAKEEKKEDEKKEEEKKDHPDLEKLEYEDKNHNINYQNHSIEDENNGNYKFKKGKELTPSEIQEEFNKYKENASNFAKVQEWIPKLKEMNLLGLKEGEKSQYYELTLKIDGENHKFYSTKGFKLLAPKENYAPQTTLIWNLATNEVIERVVDYSQAPQLKNIIGSLSDDIKNYEIDQYNSSYNPDYPRNPNSKPITEPRDGAYAKKIINPDGSVSYEFYDGIKNFESDEVSKVMKENPSKLKEELGESNFKVDYRAYMAAIVNSYLAKNEPSMSHDLRKNIVDYVYRFGLNLKSDESVISKSENNGYVDVSPLGYASANPDGSYRYKYQVSFNSITSNDVYSSTHLDIYAPTMSKNIKFTLDGIQEYKKKDDGTYSYTFKNVNVALPVANTKDKEIRELINEDIDKLKNMKEKDWNNEDYKHKEATFTLPYFNDLNGRRELKNKVIEFDKNVYMHADKPELDEDKYKKGYDGSRDFSSFKPEVHYRHFRLINPQAGGPITFTVE